MPFRSLKSTQSGSNGCVNAAVLTLANLVVFSVAQPPTHSLPQPQHSSRQVEVDFLTGPNLVEYQYAVGCYNATDNVDCGDILSGGAESIDSVSGLLPRKYSRVEANLTVRDRYALISVLFVGIR